MLHCADMKILAIETSCDETSLAILELRGAVTSPTITRLAHTTASQIELHAHYGGVFPALAKREHAKAFTPLLETTLRTAKLFKKGSASISKKTMEKIKIELTREPELFSSLENLFLHSNRPQLDAIAVTTGPGLEPALWVGINAAKALALAWGIPVIPVNHMEGHVLSVLIQQTKKQQKTFKAERLTFPVLSLLVSGGHTELVLMRDWMKYKKIGATRDDAVGEAFDKVARMLDLPYPGGPKISALAHEYRTQQKEHQEKNFSLPRPMLTSKDFDFSFSGLKTAVLYLLRSIEDKNDLIKKQIAHEFETAAIEVLVHKTTRALMHYKCKTLVVGGGVAANTYLKNTLTSHIKEKFPKIRIYFPERELATDNAFMIGIVGGITFLKKKKGVSLKKLRAQGTLSL